MTGNSLFWNILLAIAFAIPVVYVGKMAMTVIDSSAIGFSEFTFESPAPMTNQKAIQPGDRPTGAVIVHATTDTFENQVLRSSTPVLVDFYADWCEPCQIQGRILNEFASEFKGGKIVKINVDESPELAARYEVGGLPTLLIFQDGDLIARQVGLATNQQLKAAFFVDGNHLML